MEETRSEEIARALSEDVLPEHITQRGSGRKKLDYVTGRYVKQRLNEIFGWDGWTYTIVEQRVITANEDCIRWFAHVALSVNTEDGCIERHGMAVGHGLLKSQVWENGKNTGRYEPVSVGRANEVIDFAAAEAVTDALKRAAVSLGQNLGLSLYDYAKGGKSDHPEPSEGGSGDIFGPPKPNVEEPKEKGTVETLALKIGSAITMDDLRRVWHEVNQAGLSEEKKAMLNMLKESQKRKLS